MIYEPTGDYILVRSEDRPKNLIMPDGVDPTSDEVFRVVKCGPGNDDYPMSVKEGDLIFLIGYINKMRYRGDTIIIARSRDVAVIVKEE